MLAGGWSINALARMRASGVFLVNFTVVNEMLVYTDHVFTLVTCTGVIFVDEGCDCEACDNETLEIPCIRARIKSASARFRTKRQKKGQERAPNLRIRCDSVIRPKWPRFINL